MIKLINKLKDTMLWKKISYSALYQGIRFPERSRESKREYYFFKLLLGHENELFFDIGANTGEKAATLRKLAKKLVCFEPSPNALNTLRSRFAWTNVTIIPIAINNIKSVSKLYIVENRETLNSINNKQLEQVIRPVTGGKKVDTVDIETDTLDNMIQKFGQPQYIKIDVEGNEMEVISGLSKPVRFLSFENCTPNFLAEGLAAIDHLCQISDGAALFNIYEAGTFLFREFTNAEVVKNHLKNHSYGAAEIFCRTL